MAHNPKKRIFFILLLLLAVLCACTETDPSSSPVTETDLSVSGSSSTDTVGISSDTAESTDTPGTDEITTDDHFGTDTADTSENTEDVTTAPDSSDTSEDEGGVIEPPSVETGSLELVMVGDILMHDPVLESGKKDGGYSYTHLFRNVQSVITLADIAMFNQEVIIAGDKYPIKGYPRFNAPFELADAIAAVGFDVALHATNHTLDLGRDAMLDCLEYWQTAHPEIEAVGMHDSAADADIISVVEENGIKIAILNYTYGLNPAGEGDIERYPYLVDVLGESRVRADIQKAKEISDVIVVAVHWGNEYQSTPSSTQKKWAKLFLECGVDVVIGTHPHVLQPVEWMEGEDGQRMLVYWSLGNFVNCTAERGEGKGERMLGAMARVRFERDAEGEVYIKEATAIPLITHINYAIYGITTYFFDEYTEEMFSENKVRDIDSTLNYDYCIEKFEEMLGDFWTR